MGVEALAMGLEDGKLQNYNKLVSIEKSRDQLFASGITSTSVNVIKARCSGGIFRF